MKQFLKRLTLHQQVVAAGCVLVLAATAAPSYFLLKSLSKDIDFATWEHYGNRYQQPLEQLLEALSQHRMLAHRSLAGEGNLDGLLAASATKIDAALAALLAVDRELGRALQFTPEGLSKRKREHFRADTLSQEWRQFERDQPALTAQQSDQSHRHLVADVRTMITHLGDTSNLILDPDLDSYYLMDATLLALPESQDRLTRVEALGREMLASPAGGQRVELVVATRFLRDIDLARIVNDVQTSLREDRNFYGLSATLQQRLPPALSSYKTAAAELLDVTAGILDPGDGPVSSDVFAAAGAKARSASFELWQTAVEELDALIEERRRALKNARFWALALSLVVPLALSGFMLRLLITATSQQQRSEAALLESAHRYRSMFECVPLPMWILDEDTLTFLAVNREAIQKYGYSEQEFLGMHTFELRPPEEVAALKEQRGARRRAPSRHRQWKHKKRDGSIFDVEVNSEFVDWNGRPAVLVLADDVTERKRAERERDAMEIQLRHGQKLESIGQLAAGVAHEINTPTQYIGDNIHFLKDAFRDLTVLLRVYEGFLAESAKRQHAPAAVAEVMAAAREADAEYLLLEIPKAIEQSLDGVNRVSTLVKAMKEFSHPGQKEKTLTDLNHAIAGTLTVARNEWKYVAELETDYDPSLPLVPCHVGDFNQVILNLIVNAAHAITDAKDRGRGKITVRTRAGPQSVEVQIEDSGTGIPEGVRDRVFDPFFTTKDPGQGTGQGLAIARSVVVNKHGGSIHFETKVGSGTTFIIRLPLDGAVLDPAGASVGEPALLVEA